MTPHQHCEDHRVRLLEDRHQADGRRHLSECGACQAWFQRAERLRGTLETLAPRQAPAELDARLAHEITLGGLRRPAPGVLDRLVEEEVGLGADAGIARALAGLPRLSAPHALESAVAREIAAPTVVPTARPRLRLVRTAASIAAAALVLLGVRSGLDGSTRPEPRFRIRMVDSPQALNGLGRGLAAGLRGAPLTDNGSAERGEPTERGRAQ
ncbi:MAG: hypothetical protein AAFZ65_18060 [Planctomycetota bacterium]